MALADEAHLLADRLQELARAAANLATQAESSSAQQHLNFGSVGVDTAAAEAAAKAQAAAELEAEEEALSEEEALLASLRDEISHWRSQGSEADARRAAAQKEAEAEFAAQAELAARAAVSSRAGHSVSSASAIAWKHEASAEVGRDCADVWQRAQSMEQEAERCRREVDEEEEVERRATAALRRELAEAEGMRSKASDERKALLEQLDSANNAGEGQLEARAVLEEADAAQVRCEQLEEERSKTQEELDSLRFQVKDMKKTQHKRAQELDGQVRRLEKQRDRLKAEYAFRIAWEERDAKRKAEREEGATIRLEKLQDLNSVLISQVQEANREREIHVEARHRVEGEHLVYKQECQHKAAEVARCQEALDEVAESEGSLRSELRQLQNRVSMVTKQAATLSLAAVSGGAQLEETEANLERVRNDEANATRRLEIQDWKLQVASTYLNHGSTSSSSRNRRDRGTNRSSADSDSTATTGGAGSMA
eukprot:TRINITY_DN32407_c0_g1_i1.p1 TRINITY_DN32407_c0_g1~~TRINITY_DN32407_c0_g1_i1.p1  ORF type:complete len:483 (-),score=140.48 TRINITY_DN32407_c0_g1_i1:119-1567(-)